MRADPASPEDLHDAARLRFLDSDRLGYVESIDRTAGFAGHGFGALPYGSARRQKDSNLGGAWTLERLDLISVLLHAMPVAYLSDRLPAMEELRGAMTRPLNDFEASGLASLNDGEDVFIDESTRGDTTDIRMVGALRAGESCATCHEVPRGTLLGAFSYRLSRVPSLPRSRPSAGG